MSSVVRNTIVTKTKNKLLHATFFHEPFVVLYAWMPFLLRKDLLASPFQVALLITLKPLISVFSFYWISANSQKHLRANLMLLGILGRIPFLLFFWIDSIGFLIFASTLYMLFSRAAIAPWMEILKRNLPDVKREKIFSFGSALGYAEGVILAFSLGWLLDYNPHLWRGVFFCSAILGMIGVALQATVPLNEEIYEQRPQSKSLKEFLIGPWKTCFELLKTKTDFAKFQWGFMAGGIGIMMVVTVLPIYFVDTLNLSHTNFASARQICMGFGFVLSSSFWARALNKRSITQLTFWICAGFGLFAGLLLLGSAQIIWIYIAYIFYGVAQGGSHNLWHLSGPLFARGEDSSQYSGINIITVGIRGLFVPALSMSLYSLLGPQKVILCGMCICFLGAIAMLKKPKQSLVLED